MKVLVVLALAVAVAQAGFSGSLTQQARPHLQQAMQQIRAGFAARAPARNSAEAAFQAKFLQGIQEHIEAQLNNIQSAVTDAHATVQQIVQAAQNAATQLQQVGNGAAHNVQDIVSSFIASVMGFLNNNGRALSPAMQAIVAQVVQDPTFIGMVHDSLVYQCLSAEGIEVTFPMVQAINADKPNGWNNFLAEPSVQVCIDQAGGLTQMIQGSSIVQPIQEMLKPLGLENTVTALITANVGEPWATQIMQGLFPVGRGIFSSIGNAASNAWEHVSGAVVDGASSAWNSVSNGASNFADYVSQLASNVLASAPGAFDIIKQIALEFVGNGVSGLVEMAAGPAYNLMTALYPHAAALGNVYTQAVDLYQSVHGVFNPAN